MADLSQLKPFINLPPGHFIKDRLEEREWTQEELAAVLDITPKHLGQVMSGEKQLTYDLAQKLGTAFETSAQFWTNLYLSYLKWEEKEDPELEDTEVRSSIHSRMPIKDMVKKKWIPSCRTVKELKKQALGYWDIKELDFTFIDEQFTPCLNRKSEAYNQFNASYAATWYRKAQLVAKEYKVPAYNEAKLSTLASGLHRFTPDEANIPEFINGLQACGVKFFVLPHLEKTYLDGAAFMDGKHPVVVYTARYKRIDNFWFTVAHEIAHVLKHLGPNCPFVLDDLKRGDVDKLEREANQLAGKWLKHPEALDWIDENTATYLTREKVLACAEAVVIHPSIIIGALSHRGTISHRNLHLFNGNVLEVIPEMYQH